MLISVVTASLNRAAMLGEAIESVLAQNDPSFEHCIIDGGSTDATKELPARYPHLVFLSEPDRGIYDAWNKGLRLARGEIIGFLNSDDYYLPGAFAAVREAFADPAVEVVSGGAVIVREEAGVREPLRHYTDREQLKLTVPTVAFCVTVINARFFRRSLIERAGPMDLRYSIAADREFLLRLAKLQPREVVLDRTLYAYREHAGSLTLRAHVPSATRYRTEHLAIAEDWLARPGLSAEDARTFRRWHRQESAILALTLAQEGRLGPAWEVARRGWRLSPDWPLAAVSHAWEAIGRRFGA